MSNNKEAAKKSASAKSMSRSKERGSKDAPTEPKHLSGKNVNRMRQVAPRAVMRFAHVVNLPSGDENDQQLVNQTTITLNKMKSPPKVGGAKSSERGKEKRSHTELEVVTTDPNGFSKNLQLSLLKAGLLNDVVEEVKKQVLRDNNLNQVSIRSTPVKLTMINSSESLEAHYAGIKARRRKNNKAKSAKQVDKALGDKVKRRKRSGWK